MIIRTVEMPIVYKNYKGVETKSIAKVNFELSSRVAKDFMGNSIKAMTKRMAIVYKDGFYEVTKRSSATTYVKLCEMFGINTFEADKFFTMPLVVS